MAYQHDFFATVPRRMEQLLADELRALGAKKVRETVAGVHFSGPLEIGYKAVLWSRLANTVLLPLTEFHAPTPEALYDGIARFDWDDHMDVRSTIAVTFHSAQSAITHTRFGAQVVKDAVVDQFRHHYNRRPTVDVHNPDFHINVHVLRDVATVSLDLSGDSLHRRSYRVESVEAPLKEHTAAAVLLRAGWPEMVRTSSETPVALLDPMCGSGTLLIEGALMAADVAPGLLRDRFGFQHWRYHNVELWDGLVQDAFARRDAGMASLPQRVPVIRGTDINPAAVRAAMNNVRAAGLEGLIDISIRDIEAFHPTTKPATGLIVTNAPYGERLEKESGAVELHRRFGEILLERFPGWRATVLTGSKELGFKLGIRATKTYSLFNGRLECALLNFSLEPGRELRPKTGTP